MTNRYHEQTHDGNLPEGREDGRPSVVTTAPALARTLVTQLDQSPPPELAERLIARTVGSPMLLRLSLGQLRTAADLHDETLVEL